jgi:hypothetical protein
MPTIAVPLGLLALVPFIWFGFGAVGPIPETAERMLVALIDYAALTLAFAGGVHWGLALLPDAVRPSLRFGAGALPLVAAWAGLILAQLVAPSVALAVLFAGTLATVLTEHRASRRLLVPPHYMWLRWGVCGVALVTMAVVIVLRGVGQTIVF